MKRLLSSILPASLRAMWPFVLPWILPGWFFLMLTGIVEACKRGTVSETLLFAVAPITIWILLGRTLTLTIVHSRPFFPSVFSAINLLAYGTFLFLLRYRVSALLGAMVHASVAVVFPLYFLTYHTDPGFIPKGEPPPSYGAHISSSEGQRGEGAGGVQPNGCGMADGGSVRGGGGEVAAQQQGKQDLQHGEQELGQGQGQRQGQGQLNEEQWQSWYRQVREWEEQQQRQREQQQQRQQEQQQQQPQQQGQQGGLVVRGNETGAAPSHDDGIGCVPLQGDKQPEAGSSSSSRVMAQQAGTGDTRVELGGDVHMQLLPQGGMHTELREEKQEEVPLIQHQGLQPQPQPQTPLQQQQQQQQWWWAWLWKPSNYCHECDVWRWARSRHCWKCHRCVDRYDHHCPAIGTCVGRRNHRLFLLLIVAFIAGELTFAASCRAFLASHHLLHLPSTQPLIFPNLGPIRSVETSVRINIQALLAQPWVVLLMLCAYLQTLWQAPLLLFHLFCIGQNVTTYEWARWKKVPYMHYEGPPFLSSGEQTKHFHNPYDRGFMKNWRCFLKEDDRYDEQRLQEKQLQAR